MSQEEKEFEIFNANVRAVMQTRPGKDLMWEILSRCDLFSPMSGKYEAGKRAVGVEILSILEEADPTIYPNLILENIKND